MSIHADSPLCARTMYSIRLMQSLSLGYANVRCRYKRSEVEPFISFRHPLISKLSLIIKLSFAIFFHLSCLFRTRNRSIWFNSLPPWGLSLRARCWFLLPRPLLLYVPISSLYYVLEITQLLDCRPQPGQASQFCHLLHLLRCCSS